MAALSPDTILLTGRVAVVAGAARGAGPAIVETFAAFGAHVAACDRDKPRGELAMTVGDQVAVEVFAQAVRERWGRVDVLVVNQDVAGASGEGFEDVSPRDERLLVERQFTQVTGMIRTMLPLMRPGASIVTVVPPETVAPVRAAMRAALESLTRTLAADLAPRGIRVNAITPRTHDESLCGAAVFLAGDLAGDVTGTTVRVDARPASP
ncbi:SDR family oxidoreductase [Nonomuraea aridisoli]|uniref:Short-chain dehydrogenase n=1 Tax=Nonomuraea aridisoli TaxID=2070368 RepID=A0A2W2EXV3_9ACTN|nr:SDR family oxidoreductase [Nonomuraea aridisoli]PZG14247.1 short-chain dehydrogenase [Nonomuraea aridisoli]